LIFSLDGIYGIDRIRKENPDDPVNPVKIFIEVGGVFGVMILPLEMAV